MPRPNRKIDVLAFLPEKEAALRSRVSKVGTTEWLMEQTGMGKGTVNQYLAQLKAAGLAHIGRRNRTTRMPAAVWVKGPGEDAPMPPKLTTAVYSRRFRRNVARAISQGKAGQKFDERYRSRVALALADDLAARTRIKPQNPFSALGL